MKPWPRRKRIPGNRNEILHLLTGDKGTVSGLAKRARLSRGYCYRILTGHHKASGDTCQRIARALGVSTDTFLDVLAVYAPKRARVPKKSKSEAISDSSASKSESKT